jgi:hypothetical protein
MFNLLYEIGFSALARGLQKIVAKNNRTYGRSDTWNRAGLIR